MSRKQVVPFEAAINCFVQAGVLMMITAIKMKVPCC